MWSEAYAQAAGPPAGAGSNPLVAQLLQMAPIILIFFILYFLLIRPQQQRQKALERMLAGLKKGDRVLTSGGIVGTVLGVDGPKAVLKIADDVKVEFTKSAIVQILKEEPK